MSQYYSFIPIEDIKLEELKDGESYFAVLKGDGDIKTTLFWRKSHNDFICEESYTWKVQEVESILLPVAELKAEPDGYLWCGMFYPPDKIGEINNECQPVYFSPQKQIIEKKIPLEESVTRLEVIDKGIRALVRHNIKIELSYQDDGRTLKIFMQKRDV